MARTAVSRAGAVAWSRGSGRLGSAGWCFSAGARRRRVVPRRLTRVSVSCVRAWPHWMGGIQICRFWLSWRAPQRMRSTMGSWRPCPGLASPQRASTVSLVQLCGRRYQPRGESGALPRRVARRRLGSLMVAGVSGGCPGSWGGLAGRAIQVLRVHVDVWVVLGGLGRAGRCWVVPWVRDGWSWGVTGGCVGASWGGCSSGVLWRCLGGLWTEIWGHVGGAEQISGPLGHAQHGNG